MKVYDELTARGLIAQVTDEEEIRNLVNEGKRSFISGSTRPRIVFMSGILWRSA